MGSMSIEGKGGKQDGQRELISCLKPCPSVIGQKMPPGRGYDLGEVAVFSRCISESVMTSESYLLTLLLTNEISTLFLSGDQAAVGRIHYNVIPFFLDRVSLHRPDCHGTYYVNQVGLKVTETLLLLLLSASIKGVGHHA